MARIRSIKPEFWTDENIVELTPWARLLFIGLWNFSDDEGRMIYSPKRIKMQVFPADDLDINILCAELRRLEMIITYTVKGVEYLQVINFSKHQKIDKRRKSKLPAPNCAESPRRIKEGIKDQGRDQGNIEKTSSSSSIDKQSTSDDVAESKLAPVVDSKQLKSSGVPVSTKKQKELHSGDSSGTESKDTDSQCLHSEIILRWNGFAAELGLAQCRKLNPKRRRGINARQRDGMLDELEAIFTEIRRSEFLQGVTGRDSWKGVDFDWIFCSPNHWVRINEGKYRDKQTGQDREYSKKASGMQATIDAASDPDAEMV